MSQYPYSPREGHLDALYQTFRYLQVSLNKGQVRRPNEAFSWVNETTKKQQWLDFYSDVEELRPWNDIIIRLYVDANHVGNFLKNRRSHTGLIIYVNNSPIMWFSKQQNTVESSSFGSEFEGLQQNWLKFCVINWALSEYGLRHQQKFIVITNLLYNKTRVSWNRLWVRDTLQSATIELERH